MKFISLFALLFVLSSCSSEANMKSGSGSRKSRHKSDSSNFSASDNQKPIAEDDSSDTDQGVEIEIDVLSNDSDPDGDELTIFDLASSENSKIERSEDGKIKYTSDGDFVGIDSFTYQISDGMTVSEGQVKVRVCRRISATFQADRAVSLRPELRQDEIIVDVKGVSGEWCAWDKDASSYHKCPLSCEKVSPPISADGKSLYKSFDHPYEDNSGACTFSIRICTNDM